jgi:catechol 2,3-dioxygenase-like lactoylglutathione lyase family enzyme
VSVKLFIGGHCPSKEKKMINITRINHSAIASQNKLKEMRHFYENILGITTVKRDIPEKLDKLIPGFWMQFPNGQVHVIDCDPKSERKLMKEMAGKKGDPMGPHTAFYVEDIEAVDKHLEQNKVEYFRMENFIFSADPNGNTVEFQQDPECSGAS